MWTLLNPKMWIAGALVAMLAASFFTAYRAGAASVRAAWQAQITMQTQATLKSEQDARAKEQVTTAKLTKANNDLQREKAAHAATTKRLAGGLRDFTAALDRPAPADAISPGGTYGTGGLERELLGDCARALVGLATEADRMEIKIVGLQDYVKAVSK